MIHVYLNSVSTRIGATIMIAVLMNLVTALPAFCGHHCPTRPKTLQMQILAINDFHGQLTEGRYVNSRPVGSAPVLAAYLKAASKGLKHNTFIVHAGDLVGGSPPESALLQDEPTIQFFNLLGKDACGYGRCSLNPGCNLVGTVGNHEFDEGRQEMLRLFMGGNHVDGPFLQDPWKGAAFAHVCANVIVDKTQQPLLPPFVIKRIRNVPVAFIGAVLQETTNIVTASGIEGLSFLNEAEAINAQVAELKRLGIRTIIVLLHQGGSQDSYSGSTESGADDVSGDIVQIVQNLDSEVDVVVSGHWHGFTNAMITTTSGARILVTQAWSKGTAYADIDLTLDARTRDVVTKSAEIVTTWADEGPGLQPDPAVQELVAQARAATEPLTSQIIAESATAITDDQNSAGESALGNLITDAQRSTMATDFALMNPGGIRSSLDAGEVTWGALYTIQPFNNYLIAMELTGQQLYNLLNQQFTPYQPYDRMLQVAGLTYTWDAAGADNDKVVEIRKDGAPIDRDAIYTVTVNSFLAEGGDLFSVLLDGANPQVGPIDLDALIAYIETLDQPFTYAVQDRIERLN